MDSRYAYVHFFEGINESDVNKNGEIVLLNEPIYAGETDIMSVEQYQRFKKDFPDRIKGGIIKKDNVMSVINLLYSQVKEEIASLPELDSYAKSRLENVQQFEINGVLKPDHETETSINDLVNKYFILQEQVRKAQRANVNKTGFHR